MDEKTRHEIEDLLDGVELQMDWLMTSFRNHVRNDKFSCEEYVIKEIQSRIRQACELLGCTDAS